jgi:hypothetical protein
MKKARAFHGKMAGAIFGLAVLVAAGACSSGSDSSTPTQPLTPTTISSNASISGQISTGGRPASGIRVAVEGQSLVATSDGSGRFTLTGVASGDRLLRFDSSSASASAVVQAVQPDEQIVVKVALSGSSAQLTTVSRSSNGGNGSGGSPNPTGGQPDSGALRVDASPSDWDLCDASSNGNLNLFIRGEGYKDVDPTSLTLLGDDPAATPIAPTRARIEGEHLKAQFSRQAAFALLLQPLAAGETRTFTLSFLQLGAPVSLTFTVDLQQSDLTCTDEDDSLDD